MFEFRQTVQLFKIYFSDNCFFINDSIAVMYLHHSITVCNEKQKKIHIKEKKKRFSGSMDSVGIPAGFSLGMGWVWRLKSSLHGIAVLYMAIYNNALVFCMNATLIHQ